MPTKEDLIELRTKCTWEWTQIGDMSGYNVRGPNGVIIFLPAAAGFGKTTLSNVGVNGVYWSSSLGTEDSSCAWTLGFHSEYIGTSDYGRNRCYGFSIRPVSD